MPSRFTYLGSFLLIAGCGGASTSPANVPIAGTKPPVTHVVGSDTALNYDAATNTVTIKFSDRDVVLSADAFRSQTGIIDIEAFSDGLMPAGSLPDFVAFRMNSSSGQTSAEMYMKTSSTFTTSPSDDSFGSRYARHTNTEIPTSGTATMHGRYIGALSQTGRLIPANNQTVSYWAIYGDVELTVDFAEESISGLISNRQAITQSVLGSAPTIVDDLVLTKTDIANDGSYSAATSGGGYRPSSTGNVTGTYTGIISGANATESAGAVAVFHDYSTSGHRRWENGVYVAQ